MLYFHLLNIFIFLFINVNDLIIKINDDGSGVKAGFKPSLGLNKITQLGGQYSFTNDSNNGAELIVSLGLQGFSNKEVSAQKVNWFFKSLWKWVVRDSNPLGDMRSHVPHIDVNDLEPSPKVE